RTGGARVGVAGSLVLTDGEGPGIGISAVVNDIDRHTVAFIGASPSVDADATPAASSTLEVGNVTVGATTEGVIVGVAVAGLVNTAQAPTPPTADDPTTGKSVPTAGPLPAAKSGVGFAGGASVNFIRDTTLAYLNTQGDATVGTLGLNAGNHQVLVSVTGGVALSLSAGTAGGGGSSIGGAFSLNQLTADTRAFLKGVTLTSTAADEANRDEVSVV